MPLLCDRNQIGTLVRSVGICALLHLRLNENPWYDWVCFCEKHAISSFRMEVHALQMKLMKKWFFTQTQKKRSSKLLFHQSELNRFRCWLIVIFLIFSKSIKNRQNLTTSLTLLQKRNHHGFRHKQKEKIIK